MSSTKYRADQTEGETLRKKLNKEALKEAKMLTGASTNDFSS
jgi:hypothetical protein